MRKNGQIVEVVDFGSREFRVLLARQDEDGTIRIIGHGTASGKGCIHQGVIQNLHAAQVALKKAMGDAEKEARTKSRALFCGVEGSNVETFIREGKIELELELVEQQHMTEALEIAKHDTLSPGKHVSSSVTAQEWYVDDLRVMDPMGIRGHVLKTRVHFARIPTVIEDNILSCIESQRRELEEVIFMPLASAAGCLTPEDMELGVAVLDMGRSNTGLAVYRDYRILGTHCFQWGGYHLTRDVAAGLQISFEEADDLILEYGISDGMVRQSEEDTEEESRPSIESLTKGDQQPARIKLKSVVKGAPAVVERGELDSIIYERAEELMTKVRQHLKSRGLMQNLVRGLVLTGGAANIRNQVALAESVMQAPCRLGAPANVEILPHEVNGPQFSAAVGLVRHAFDYHAAMQNGRLTAVGPVKKLGRFFRRYFF